MTDVAESFQAITVTDIKEVMGADTEPEIQSANLGQLSASKVLRKVEEVWLPTSGHDGITPIQHMASSCSGALVVSLFVTPLDVVKIRLQAQAKPLRSGQCFLYCNGLMDHLCVCLNGNNGNTFVPKPWYKLPGHFNGTVDAFVKIARTEGVASLWSGLPPTLVMAVPATVIYFTCYDYLKYGLGHTAEMPIFWAPIVAGSFARVIAASVISPIELVRTKMQSEKLSYRDMSKAVRMSVSHGGWLSLWSGLGPTLLRDVPFSAIYWTGYETIKSRIQKSPHHGLPTFSEAFIAGGLSGMIAAILTIPFDVVKTQRQIELGEAALFDKTKPKSTGHLMKNIYIQRGFKGLFAGITPRLIKVSPACAVMISTYEYCKTFFRSCNQKPRTNPP